MGLSRALGGRRKSIGEKKKKRSIRFFLFFSFGVIFPVVGSQLSHPPLFFFSELRVGRQHIGMMKKKNNKGSTALHTRGNGG